MERNNILTAPQVATAASFYNEWRDAGFRGGMTAFYKFMTTPSTDRDRFIGSVESDITFNGSVVSLTLRHAIDHV